jgi:signal transduction histidine kinase
VDISEQKLLEQRLLGAILETEDKERKRFSEDLHDGLGPLLSTIRLYFNQLQLDDISKVNHELLFKSIYELLDEAILTTKSIANNILPGTISDYGLVAALKSFCNRIESTGIIRINFENNIGARLIGNLENTIYRIVIELVNNTIKHAKATQINIILFEHDDFIEVSYDDDGIGCDFSSTHTGLGINNIRNRCKSIGAELSYFSKENEGIKVFIIIRK